MFLFMWLPRMDGVSQIIMNVLAFVPIGASLAVALRKSVWWQVLLTGCLVSLCVELLQFYYKRGLCEIDDVIHNTTGCMIGYGVAKLIAYAHSAFMK